MSSSEAEKKWLCIDTDAGVDDAFALAMGMQLAPIYGFDIKFITTVFGNCGLEQVIKNVAKTRAACGKDCLSGPSIIRGCEHPIIKETLIDATYFHGQDGLGNNSFPDEESGVLDGNNAAHEIIKMCYESKEQGAQLTLLMLGPLTNLARAIQIDETCLMHVDKLVIIGGCGNGHGNVRRTTEFNVNADCEGASIVFTWLADNNKLCTLVSWELTLATSIPWQIFDELNSEESTKKCRLNHFLSEISQFSYAFTKRNPIPHFSDPGEHFNGAVICDALAMAVALNPDSVITSSHDVNTEVELAGHITRGQTVVDWGCYDGIIRPKNCKWVMQIDDDVYRQMFRDIYNELGTFRRICK
jgi:purine nucleosidase